MEVHVSHHYRLSHSNTPLPLRLSAAFDIADPSLDRYLFAGAFTILWAFVILFFIPDSPQTSHRWFNEEERAILARRSRESMIGAVGPTKFKWNHAREAATDIKLYIFFRECYSSRRGHASQARVGS